VNAELSAFIEDRKDITEDDVMNAVISNEEIRSTTMVEDDR